MNAFERRFCFTLSQRCSMSARADAEDVIELQSDVARNMGALGAPSLDSLSRSMVRVHQR